MAFRQERNNFRVTGNPGDFAMLLLPDKGSRGYPLRTTYAIGVVSYAFQDAEAAGRGSMRDSTALQLLLLCGLRLQLLRESASWCAYCKLTQRESGEEDCAQAVTLWNVAFFHFAAERRKNETIRNSKN